MEELMDEIRAWAAARGISPSTAIQDAYPNYGGSIWARWEAGGACSLTIAKIIRAHIAANPAPTKEAAQ